MMWILASRILCCGSNRQIHTDCRNPVEKKGLHSSSLSQRKGERAQESSTPAWNTANYFKKKDVTAQGGKWLNWLHSIHSIL